MNPKRYKWPKEVVAVLIKAHQRGGVEAVYAALPDRDKKAVDAAIDRFIVRAVPVVCISRTPLHSGEQARAMLKAMPAELFFERLALMMPRNANAVR